MKKIFVNISFFSLILMFVFMSCEKQEAIIYSGKVVYFENSALAIPENSTSDLAIRLIAAGTKDAGGSGATMTLSTAGIDNPAIEGTDFTISGNTVSYDTYYGLDSVVLTPIDNDVYETDKYVDIIITSVTNGYEAGAKDTLRVTISDNEHPLALVIGTYSASATSYFNGAEVYDIRTAPDPDDETHLLITNFVNGGSNLVIYGIVDLNAGTIQIPVGQDLVASDTNPAEIAGFYGPDGATGIPDGGYISGSIDASGNITIADEYGSQINSGPNDGYWYNIYQSGAVWTKTAKKSNGKFLNLEPNLRKK